MEVEVFGSEPGRLALICALLSHYILNDHNSVVNDTYCLDTYYIFPQECFYMYILGLKGSNSNNFTKMYFSLSI